MTTLLKGANILPPRYALLIGGESLAGARHHFLSTDDLALALEQHEGTSADLERALKLKTNARALFDAFEIRRVR